MAPADDAPLNNAPLPVDILVCGGGIGGTVAAIAAAREGADTLIIERNACLGGSATLAAIGQFVGFETRAGRQVIRGIAEEIVERLTALGGSSGHDHFTMPTGHRMDRVEYDAEGLKLVLDALAAEAGARVLFNAMLGSVVRQGTTIAEVTAITKSGPLALRPRVVIDASGDLDLLARAGAAFLGLEQGERLQPATLMFRLGPIDFSRFAALSHEELAELAQRGVASGGLPRAALRCARVPGTGDAWFNVTHVEVDATDPFALAAAEAEGRRQAFAAARYIAKAVPGCEAARLVAMAPQLGIRETRRMVGRYCVTADDLRGNLAFPDAIACGAYPVDIHLPQGAALHPAESATDHCYRVPFRALVPEGLDNVLVAGRGISATHEAHAALRVVPTVMAIGQAAGIAAAMMSAGNAGAMQLPIASLQARLIEAGAVLG